MGSVAAKENTGYTVEDIISLPDGERAELIDGVWYDMAAPTGIHQEILIAVAGELRNYIRENGGNCKVMPAPYAVFLNNDDYNYVEPDVSVICDPEKLDDKGCHGAPDLVIEIISPSTKEKDYGIKLFKYRTAGVREYWVINPDTRTVDTHFFASDNNEEAGDQVSFEEPVPCSLFPEFKIIISEQI